MAWLILVGFLGLLVLLVRLGADPWKSAVRTLGFTPDRSLGHRLGGTVEGYPVTVERSTTLGSDGTELVNTRCRVQLKSPIEGDVQLRFRRRLVPSWLGQPGTLTGDTRCTPPKGPWTAAGSSSFRT